jgi:hypothetical protein
MRYNDNDSDYDHNDDAGICGTCGERLEDCHAMLDGDK